MESVARILQKLCKNIMQKNKLLKSIMVLISLQAQHSDHKKLCNIAGAEWGQNRQPLWFYQQGMSGDHIPLIIPQKCTVS